MPALQGSMDNRSLLIIEVFFWSISAIAGVIAAIFEFRDRWQTPQERQVAQKKYRDIWITIEESGILELPEKVINWFINATRFLGTKNIRRFEGDELSVNVEASHIVNEESPQSNNTYIHSIPYSELSLEAKLVFIPSVIGTFLLIFSPIIIWLFLGVFLLKIILSLPLLYALFALPFYAITLSVILSIGFGVFISEDSELRAHHLYAFSLAIGCSFVITFIAFLLGHFTAPEQWIPKTIQMLLSNVIFDGLTLVATLIILNFTIHSTSKLRIPIGVFADIFIAALLACLSLYLGLIITERQLTAFQVFNVLIARSPDGGHPEIGPYFWVMHTTFIPTIIYMVLIILAWISKLVVLPVARLFCRASMVEKPHHLTAGLFIIIIAATFFAFAQGVKYYREYTERQPARVGNAHQKTRKSSMGWVGYSESQQLEP